jgi:hypothetical protein
MSAQAPENKSFVASFFSKKEDSFFSEENEEKKRLFSGAYP